MRKGSGQWGGGTPRESEHMIWLVTIILGQRTHRQQEVINGLRSTDQWASQGPAG